MKVLQINSVCGYGSTGGIAVDLYKELEAQGHECCIAYGRGSAPENIKTHRIGTKIGNYWHGFLSRITDKQGFYSNHATKKFVKWMLEYNPDIVQLHNLHGYYLNIDILFRGLKMLNKPVVWTLHDCWAFTGHCAHFDFVGCDKWKEECRNCKQKRAYPASWFWDSSRDNFIRKKYLYSLLNKVIVVTPSQWLKGLVEKSILSSFDVRVIYNGIDFEIFRPRPSEFRKKYRLENKKVILGVANIWDRRKGLEKFNQLAEILDHETYKIVLVGVNDCQKKGLNGNILSLNRTRSREELAEIYTMADVFVNFSEEETMGLTTVEAIACGTPVVVTNKTALPEIINYDSQSCMIKGDASECLDKIDRVRNENLDNHEVKKKFDKRQQYMKYIELYESVL